MALRKIADISLDGQEFQLAKNGGPYCLTVQVDVDAYGNPYYRTVPAKDLEVIQIEELIDLVGQQTEELAKLRVAVGRSEQ
jgi:hypothetical protein